MSHWDSNESEIIHYPPEDLQDYPGWEYLDCGCCAGIEWGGDCPRECRTCGGAGYLFHHKKSGVLAEYPGGPFMGKSSR
jgi:hypothetical protein